MMLALSCSVAPRCEDEGAAEVGVVNVSSEDCTMERLFLHWVQLSDGDFGDTFEEMFGAINPRKTASSHSSKHVPDDDIQLRFECLA